MLITGAVGNLGRAVARRFAADRRRLALLDSDAVRLAVAFGADDGKLTLACDLLAASAITSAIERVTQRLGSLGVLCSIAGGFPIGETVHETSAATWDLLMCLSARSVLHTANDVVPGMLA